MSCRQLSFEEIEQFAGRPGARRVVVENFLRTMSFDWVENVKNLIYDTRMYSWNRETYEAIVDGIALAAGETSQ